MRINLVTPFAEKDAVKALGARWDAAKKCWYIGDVADLTPFARYIPHMAATGMSGSPSEKMKPTVLLPTPAHTPESAVSSVADCGCDVLPWDDCVHTIKSRPLVQ